MSHYGVLAGLPWDDDREDDDDEMNLFESGGGDSKMSITSLPNTTTCVPAKQLSTTSLLSYMFHTAVPASTISLRLCIPNGSALL
jgi:hypothetical protein